jgi:hypothetical protein
MEIITYVELAAFGRVSVSGYLYGNISSGLEFQLTEVMDLDGGIITDELSPEDIIATESNVAYEVEFNLCN